MNRSSIDIRQKIFVHFFLVIFCILCLLPMIMTISVSITDNKSLIQNGYLIIPKKISLEAYKYIFNDYSIILNGYKNSFFIAIVGTLLNLLVTAFIAYPLSRRDFKLRGVISAFVFFTMIFSGGLVPFYILIVKYLHWKNMLISLIIPGIAAPFNIFLLRVMFQDIHPSLIESAKIDGATELKTFFRIVLPLSKPAIATLTLMIVLAYWNDAFSALLFIDDKNKFPLQLILNNITFYINQIKSGYQAGGNIIDISSVPSDSIMYAMMIIITAPMLFLFSFLQKYFVKGIAIGSVKG